MVDSAAFKDEIAKAMQAFREFSREAETELDKALVVSALEVERDAKKFSPVDTGRLRASITHRLGNNYAEVGTNVDYACIYDSNTRIVTKGKNKRISDIVPGDMVLTQTGEYRPVVRLIKNRAIDIPNMVEIVCKWRKDRNHTITTTELHKLMVNRDGRTKWVEAKDILPSDKLYIRKKIPIGKGTKKTNTCIACGKVHTGQGKKFCTIECRFEYYKKSGINPNTGSKRSDEARAKMSASAERRFMQSPESHPNKILARAGFKTSTEKKVANWLANERGLDFVEQKKIGRHFVDFYVPETNEIYEADGSYWHKSFEKDVARDRDIIAIMPGVKIYHIHFYDKRHSPKNIDPNPIEDVYYIVCNPHTDSFVSFDIFQEAEILSIKKWKYQKSSHPKASARAFVYDLEVDSVHSYVASGILVSNSHQEFGTSKMRAQPFLTPAFEANKEKIKARLAAVVKKAADNAGS